MNIDLAKTGKKVNCPVHFFVDKNDIQTMTEITRKYDEELKAPKKGLVLFEKAGHQNYYDKSEIFRNAILRTLGNTRAFSL